jgi:hypothetical protein
MQKLMAFVLLSSLVIVMVTGCSDSKKTTGTASPQTEEQMKEAAKKAFGGNPNYTPPPSK